MQPVRHVGEIGLMATRRKRLRGKVTDRQQLSLVTETLPDVKESDSRDGLKAPVRRRSSVRTTGDPRPDPSPAKRASVQKAPISTKTQRLSTRHPVCTFQTWGTGCM